MKFDFFPATAKAPLYLLAGAGIAALALRPDHDFAYFDHQFIPKIGGIGFEVEGVVRSSRALYAIAFVAVDYKLSLWGVERSSAEYRNKLEEIHLRSAQRLLKLCEKNKGFYVKAGQFVSSLRQVPKEYSSTLSKLQDKAIPSAFKDIKEVITRNFGRDITDLFYSFDETPIAAASIAQVHHAWLRDGQEVAVKYPGLRQRLAVDIRTMTILSSLVSQIFPDYRFEWMITEFKRVLSSELDFLQEAKNAERTAQNFKTKKVIKVPRIFSDLTTEQILTMQFFHGKKVDDLDFLKDSGINPEKVAKALAELFSEMIFVHGFIHGDPHPGNFLVSPNKGGGFSLVVLDHGIYKELDEQFRANYCQLWKALLLMETQKILDIGEKFGLGQYAKYFPVIFTGRIFNSKSALGEQMPAEDKAKLRQQLQALTMGDFSSFMESMPPDFLAVLRTDGQLRSIMGKLGVPAHIRLQTYARYAIRGLSNHQHGGLLKQMIYQFKTMACYLQLRIIMEIFKLLGKLEGWRRSVLRPLKAYLSNLIS
ncbi:uncharacterized protein LOC144713832 isoform X2 [Wolffia australiana]